MTLKYNFSIAPGQDPMTSFLVLLSDAFQGLFFYGVIAVFWLLLFTYFVRTSQDPELEFIRSGFPITILTVIIYFWGIAASASFVNPLFVVALISIQSAGIGYLYYTRNNDD